MVSIAGQWSGQYGRFPDFYFQGAPPLTPLAVAVANTAGDWLFCCVSWRQDAGTAGLLQYPGTVTVSDDGNNFWIPVRVTTPSTGIVRSAIWMAPAARPANFVYVSPTNYQSGLAVLVFSVTGVSVPWYSVASSWQASANQTTAISLTQTPPGVNQSGNGGNGGNAGAGAIGGFPGGGGGGGSSNNAGGGGGAGQIAVIVAGHPELNQELTTATSGSWLCPAGVTSVNVICWGGGGGGDDGAFDGGGGGGECANEPFLAVTPGHSYSYTVGFGGNGATVPGGGGGNGGTTSFSGDSVTVTAHGGTGGTGGAGGAGGTGSTNTTHFNGGAGGNGTSTAGGGGGGGSAGNGSVGGAGGSSATGGAGGTGGTGFSTGWFTVGVMAYDNTAMPVTLQSTGWAGLNTVTGSNGSSHSGDVQQFSFYGTGYASQQLGMFRNAGGLVADFAVTMIQVHGPTEALSFPYPLPLENWPVILTEAAIGPALNKDPLFAQGTTFWSPNGATIGAVNWPSYDAYPEYDTYLPQSLQITPTGSVATSKAGSEQEPINPNLQYTAVAQVYSAVGYSRVALAIDFFFANGTYSGASSVTFASVPAGAWTQITVPPSYPPQTAAFAAVSCGPASASGNVPASAVIYLGYAAFAATNLYQNLPPDQVTWSDLSTRNITQGAISISRGIQYEQQTLEAGTMSLTLANNDSSLTFGNVQSPFFPNVGDTDVQVRVRAVWPLSQTPYYVLFSGFTDQIEYGWDTGTRYGYQQLEASDAWSRLVGLMVSAAQQEELFDNPVAYIPCNGNGANLAVNQTPAVQAFNGAQTYVAVVGGGGAVASFTSSVISLPGDQGSSCWQSSRTNIAPGAFGVLGVALGFFPLNPYSLAGGMTLEFWFSPTLPSAQQPPTNNIVICTAWSGKGPMWSLTINNNPPGTATGINVTTYHRTSGAATSTGPFGPNLLSAANATKPVFISMTWNQTSWNLGINPGAPGATFTGGSQTFENFVVGFSWGGNAGPIAGGNLSPGTTPAGFWNMAVYGISVFTTIVPPARIAAHYNSAISGNPLEIDTWRLARIVQYAGANVPVAFAARGLDLWVSNLTNLPQPDGLPDSADWDLVTPATDAASQVASSYFTNIAQSTLAFLYVSGPGALLYRRRLESYVRKTGQWALGEADPLGLTLNINPLSGSGITGWVAGNGGTITAGSLSTAGPLFLPGCAVLHGDGVTSNPQILYGSLSQTPVTPGSWYAGSVVAVCPASWTSGMRCFLAWFTSSNTLISLTPGNFTGMQANSLTFLPSLPQRAPQTAAYVQIGIAATGVPPISTLFYITDAILSQVNPAAAPPGSPSPVQEVPYTIDVRLSSDRALLYNQAILTQFGTNLVTRFTGSDVTFFPSSGVSVTITNQASVALRATIPYQATLYLDNTAESPPYYQNDPSMEDFGNWITQTLASPLFRPNKVTITPGATPEAMQMALSAEVGDTVTFRRRAQGTPTVQILTYISKITHSIDISAPSWTVSYELSPFPQGAALISDDPVHGTLTGGNLWGW